MKLWNALKHGHLLLKPPGRVKATTYNKELSTGLRWQTRHLNSCNRSTIFCIKNRAVVRMTGMTRLRSQEIFGRQKSSPEKPEQSGTKTHTPQGHGRHLMGELDWVRLVGLGTWTVVLVGKWRQKKRFRLSEREEESTYVDPDLGSVQSMHTRIKSGDGLSP